MNMHEIDRNRWICMRLIGIDAYAWNWQESMNIHEIGRNRCIYMKLAEIDEYAWNCQELMMHRFLAGIDEYAHGIDKYAWSGQESMINKKRWINGINMLEMDEDK